MGSSSRFRRPLLARAVRAGLLALLAGAAAGQAGQAARPEPEGGSAGCIACHAGIEDMHPAAGLSCVDCHGGDATARTSHQAHVQPAVAPPGDERTRPLDVDLAWVRFVNPMDLRVVDRTCGSCHADLCRGLETSLHGTTAGHLSDGFYEMGLVPECGSRYGIFAVDGRDARAGGEVRALLGLPEFDARTDPARGIGQYFPDLVRKECMQCHLYSNGRAVRGRLGFDGDYRGSGCAACHVTYGAEGLSESADATADRATPGHPLRHQLASAPPTETCTACHNGDASIGLHFRGLSQLPPGAPGGPDIPGTTDALRHRAFFANDPGMCPPDVHHERGLHCIDCHTLADVMGDGRLHGQMEHAVEISCQACHGTFTRRSDLRTERGTPLTHLFEEGGQVYLRSKVTGEVHPVRQVVDLLDPAGPDFDPEAHAAMTADHAGLECYACHAGWNVNFLGFHFYRNESLTQLDILSGKRTPGRVTTQEKVFASWKSFYAGRNESGRIAPYMTGFSTMGTVDDADGVRLLDQAMPVTAAGLSGVTMVHHQTHSVRPTARACVECHRTSSTWGMGSPNFRLARQLAFVADRRGIEVVALERGQLAASTPLAKLVLPDVVALELDCDPLQGHGRTLFAAEGRRGIHVVDVSDPLHPRRVDFVASVQPRGMALAGRFLFSADGPGGLRVYDVGDPADVKRVATVPMFDAHHVEVRWPYAYVADGPGGLVILDVRAPISPRIVGGYAAGGGEDAVVDLDLLFQYSRPQKDFAGDPADYRSEARQLCALLDEERGPVLLDVTEPGHVAVLWPLAEERRTQVRPRERLEYRGLALRTKVDLAGPQGGSQTEERDYLYVVEERVLGSGDGRSFLRALDVSDPRHPRRGGRVATGDQTEMLVHGSFYNSPFLQPVAFVPGDDGVFLTDLTLSDELSQLGTLPALRTAYVVALEEFPFDRMLDEDGVLEKDVSRRPSRWLTRAEIEHVLDVPALALGTLAPDERPDLGPWSAERQFFARCDADRDGLLTGPEIDAAGGAGADADGDGRVTLLELAALGDGFRTDRTAVEQAPREDPFLRTRVDADGDLARLFDGLAPEEYDQGGDGRLDRRDLSRALFDALDLDGDGRVDAGELSRHPGAMRELRYGDAPGFAAAGVRGLERGRTLSRADVKIADAEWEALDRDGDGAVQLERVVDPRASRQGAGPPPPEWPTRRAVHIPLPPVVSSDAVLARFDTDGDGALSRRELRARPDLLAALDGNGDGVVAADELTRAVDRVAMLGVDATPDAFEERWDLDGDGRVGPGEVSAAVLWLSSRRAR